MTACGYFWTCVVIALAVVAVTVSAFSAEKNGRGGYQPKGQLKTPPPNRASSIAPDPVAFRRGEARIVRCEAVTRLDDGYFVGMSGPELDAKARNYAKKELAALLAEQALAAGGIEFTQVGGELRAVMRTVSGEAGE